MIVQCQGYNAGTFKIHFVFLSEIESYMTKKINNGI